jgi:hypothetical protein
MKITSETLKLLDAMVYQSGFEAGVSKEKERSQKLVNALVKIRDINTRGYPTLNDWIELNKLVKKSLKDYGNGK